MGDALVNPCGGCRHRMREFAGRDVRVHTAGTAAAGIRSASTAGMLLPRTFGADIPKSDPA